MKNNKNLRLASALLLMSSVLFACGKTESNKKEPTKVENKKEESKSEKKAEKKEVASKEDKDATIKALEEQKALELAIPTNTDSDKKSIESKYKSLIDSVKEDALSKDEVLKLKASSEKYVKSIKEAQGKGDKKEEKK